MGNVHGHEQQEYECGLDEIERLEDEVVRGGGSPARRISSFFLVRGGASSRRSPRRFSNRRARQSLRDRQLPLTFREITGEVVLLSTQTAISTAGVLAMKRNTILTLHRTPHHEN